MTTTEKPGCPRLPMLADVTGTWVLAWMSLRSIMGKGSGNCGSGSRWKDLLALTGISDMLFIFLLLMVSWRVFPHRTIELSSWSQKALKWSLLWKAFLFSFLLKIVCYIKKIGNINMWLKPQKAPKAYGGSSLSYPSLPSTHFPFFPKGIFLCLYKSIQDIFPFLLFLYKSI